MNTVTHLTLALATLARDNKAYIDDAFNKKLTGISVGALLPDIPMFFLYAYEVIIGTSQRVIWDEKYFSPLWQNTIDIFNSIPLFIIILLLSVWRKVVWLQFFCYAALLHIVFDLPLHHDDGHRHFFPFSDWTFSSPVSYWDPAHYGHYWSVIELLILVGTIIVAYKLIRQRWAKILLVVAVIANILLPLFYYLTLN